MRIQFENGEDTERKCEGAQQSRGSGAQSGDRSAGKHPQRPGAGHGGGAGGSWGRSGEEER